MANNNINEEAKFIAFATQEDGAGKSVFSVLMASMLHYKMDYNVVVVDCDFPKYSVRQMREHEIKLVEEDDRYKSMYENQTERLQKRPYTVLCSPAENAIGVVRSYLASCTEHIDLVIFDLPGTAKSVGVLQCIASLDHLFTPITSDSNALENSLSFALTVQQSLLQNSTYALRGIRLFWNMVDERERTDLYDIYNESIESLGLQILQTTLPATKRFKRKLSKDGMAAFCSTLFPPSPKMLHGSRFDHLVVEIIKTIKLKPNE